jgi:hypothetical protein
LVETIVAVAVSAIVLAAIFPIFLLLYRVETSGGNARQARVSGLLAEESLVRDIRAYQVKDYGSRFVLCSLDKPGGPSYLVSYSIQSGQLMRTVSGAAPTMVARGIQNFTAKPSSDGKSVQVAIWTIGIGDTKVPIELDSVVAPRNPLRCP